MTNLSAGPAEVPSFLRPKGTPEELLQQAIEHHLAGRLTEAGDLYRSILAAHPAHPDAHHNLGALAIAAGEPRRALAHFRSALRANPNHGQYWLSCVEALLQTQQPQAAQGLFEQGLRNGLRGPAVDAMRERLQLVGFNPAGPKRARGKTGRRGRGLPSRSEPSRQHTEPVMGLYAEGRYVEAEALARRLIRRFPDHGFGWKALGVMLQQQGRLEEALEVKEQSAALLPRDAEAQSNLGNALLKMLRLEEAEACYRRALALQPDYPEAWSNLGITLQKLGRLGEAEAACRRALALRATYPDASSNLGIILQEANRLHESERSFAEALAADPGHSDAWNNLGITLQRLGRLIDAEAAHRRSIQLNPTHADAYTNLAGCLQQQARFTEAEACYGRAIELDPAQMNSYTNLLFCLSHNPRTTPEALHAAHLRFADQFEAPLRAGWRPHANSPDPDRPLRIGFLSADFRAHAMSHFIEPTLTALADHPEVTICVYANQVLEDDLTSRLRAKIPLWTEVFGLSDLALAETIRKDGIDILVDLSGHTGGNRLLALAHKPAPIQCGWIGYLGTSGMQAMDYYLADPYFLPPGDFDHLFTERLAHLPAVSSFEPHPASPAVSQLPALVHGYVTFGSFSRMGKLSAEVVALWSQILRAVPGSRLLLGAMPRDLRCERLAGWFKAEGIESERLRFLPGTGLLDYLALHHQVDLCLDPFPFTGGTTTGHALWMGVPTITLAGRTAPGRLGAAMLRHAGLDDFVADSEAEFVRKGVYWAEHLAELADLRASMRTRFRGCPLGQPRAVSQGFAALFRRLWREWCLTRPAAAPVSPLLSTRESCPAELEAGSNPEWIAAEGVRLLALLSSGNDEEAAALAQTILKHQPAAAFAWNVLGAVHQRQDRRADAELCYRSALQADPDYVEALYNLGRLIGGPPAFAEAEACFRRVLALRPGHLQAEYGLGEIYYRQGRLEEAVASYRRALRLNPELAEAHNNLGIALQHQGESTGAEAAYREALRLSPDFAEAHNNLAITLKHQGQPQAAEASCRKALAIRPGYVDAWTNLALALTEQGRMEEAAAAFRRALEIDPDLPAIGSGLLFCLSHTESSPSALFAEHLRFAARLEAPLRPHRSPSQNSRDPDRPLRVGFISGDLRGHAMAHFIEPLWEQLASHADLSLFAYANSPIEDRVTERLRGHVPNWRKVFGVPDEGLDALIRGDQIDILVDLAGHTAGNRLRALVRKPAPVQCGWIGYLGSSGLAAIDYYLADSVFLPAGEFEPYFSESIVRLSAVACFRPSPAAPVAGPLPALTTDGFTFGSFSRLAKITPQSVALWSELLRALPDSRILLGGMPRDRSCERLANWFADQQIAPQRIQFQPATGMEAYFDLLQQVDLCLDPFPFTGATTTAHALWMGVPTLTLAGKTPAGRLGPAILHSAGVGAFAVNEPAELLSRGISWANDLSGLNHLRFTLRETMRNSALCHPSSAGEGFSAAFRLMWRTWCGAPASARDLPGYTKVEQAISEENQP